MLRGAEWELFRAGLDSLWDWIEATLDTPGAHRTGVRVFDRLQVGQKLAMLALVGEALADEAVPTPALTALVEGAAAAVFQFLRHEMTAEIDMADESGPDEDPTYWRARILAAFAEAEARARGEAEAEVVAGGGPTGPGPADGGDDEDEDSGSLPAADSDDLDDWESLLDSLAERLFWDEDYDMEEAFADADPDEAAARKRAMLIRDDYFTAIAPDPTEEQLEEVRRTLARVCGRPKPEDL